MAADGSLPLELERTKPYGYSIFVLDSMSTLCQILSNPSDDLFEYTNPKWQEYRLGTAFFIPLPQDKSAWPYRQDVMYWEEWPIKQPCLLFGGMAFHNEKYIDLWLDLHYNDDTPEVVRNMPVIYPLLWLQGKA